MSQEGMNCIIIMVCLLAFIVSEGKLREAKRIHATNKAEIMFEVHNILTARGSDMLILKKKMLDDMYTQYRYIQRSLSEMLEEEEQTDMIKTESLSI